MEKKCRYCPRVCHKQEHLDRHERTHTKIRPYRCEACEKHFVRRYLKFRNDAVNVFSDTLKRHQKLHTMDGRKESGRNAKTLKRPGADTNTDALYSHPPSESSVNHPHIQEIVSPQIYIDFLDVWKIVTPDPTIANTVLPYHDYGTYGSYFDEDFTPFEEVSVGSAGSDSTVDSEALVLHL